MNSPSARCGQGFALRQTMLSARSNAVCLT